MKIALFLFIQLFNVEKQRADRMNIQLVIYVLGFLCISSVAFQHITLPILCSNSGIVETLVPLF